MVKIIKVSALAKYMFNFSIPLSSFDLSNTFETIFFVKISDFFNTSSKGSSDVCKAL